MVSSPSTAETQSLQNSSPDDSRSSISNLIHGDAIQATHASGSDVGNAPPVASREDALHNIFLEVDAAASNPKLAASPKQWPSRPQDHVVQTSLCLDTGDSTMQLTSASGQGTAHGFVLRPMASVVPSDHHGMPVATVPPSGNNIVYSIAGGPSQLQHGGPSPIMSVGAAVSQPHGLAATLPAQSASNSFRNPLPRETVGGVRSLNPKYTPLVGGLACSPQHTFTENHGGTNVESQVSAAASAAGAPMFVAMPHQSQQVAQFFGPMPLTVIPNAGNSAAAANANNRTVPQMLSGVNVPLSQFVFQPNAQNIDFASAQVNNEIPTEFPGDSATLMESPTPLNIVQMSPSGIMIGANNMSVMQGGNSSGGAVMGVGIDGGRHSLSQIDPNVLMSANANSTSMGNKTRGFASVPAGIGDFSENPNEAVCISGKPRLIDIGANVIVKILNGETFTGEVFCLDYTAFRCLILKEPLDNDTANFRMISLKMIADIVVTSCPPPGVNVAPPLPAVDLAVLQKREKNALQEFEARKHTVGVNVTEEAQEIFDFIHKTHPDCRWAPGGEILVMGIRVPAPYDVCAGSEDKAVKRMQEVLTRFRQRRQRELERQTRQINNLMIPNRNFEEVMYSDHHNLRQAPMSGPHFLGEGNPTLPHDSQVVANGGRKHVLTPPPLFNAQPASAAVSTESTPRTPNLGFTSVNASPSESSRRLGGASDRQQHLGYHSRPYQQNAGKASLGPSVLGLSSSQHQSGGSAGSGSSLSSTDRVAPAWTAGGVAQRGKHQTSRYGGAPGGHSRELNN